VSELQGIARFKFPEGKLEEFKRLAAQAMEIGSIGSARDRRWLILGVIGLAQLMVILDLTVMNIALPSAQRALGFTTVDRQAGTSMVDQ
jgi:hypothetical protein